MTRLMIGTMIGALIYSAPGLAQATPQTGSPAAADDSRAKIEMLESQVKALQQSLEALKAQVADATPTWKGAPQFADKKEGWSFKPRGRLMFDAGYVGRPDGYDNSGLGFTSELRRARLGVEGTIPGGLGYKFEADFATGDVEFADAYLSYATGPFEFTVGHHNNFQSLEELTSSLHTSFIERAAFTDAFGFERRVGISGQYLRGPFLAQAGAFTDSVGDLNSGGDDNNGHGVDTRAVFMPKLGKTQLHFAGSYHWRDLGDSETSVRYRQRPAVHTTDIRFVDTGNIAGTDRETGYGLEAAGIFGPFHIASEAYWQKLSRQSGLQDPDFFGAYVEAGYFLTGESRGYKAGKFDRVKVNRPFGKGGAGAFSVNGRFDYLDLNDGAIVGGRQKAYQASLNWKPTDYVLFGLNYAHILYDDSAIDPAGDRNFSVDSISVRSQIDF